MGFPLLYSDQMQGQDHRYSGGQLNHFLIVFLGGGKVIKQRKCVEKQENVVKAGTLLCLEKIRKISRFYIYFSHLFYFSITLM